MHKILFALQFLLFLAFSAGANAQTISSLSPASGPVGVLVTITGTGFGSTQGSSTVSFNGTAASPCGTCWSATSISVLVPTGATTGNVVVTVGGVASNGVGFTVTALPSGWSDGDIGTVGQTGSSSYANGVFTVKGAGAGVTGTSDAFHFVYQPLSGNGTIVARVVSLQGSGSGYIYPAAGVMIRNSLASNDMSAFTDYYQASLNYNFVYRTTSGGSAGSASGSGSQTLPYWVMVVRNGSTFTSYIAMDGVNWVQVGTSQTISMAQNVYVGLGVTNGTTTALATATFDSVSVNSTANPGPVITTISATTGSVGSQVVITGTGFGATQNGSLVTLNNSPMTITSWSATSIATSIPTGATSGPLLVSVAPSMNDSNPIEFTVTSQPLPMLWLDQDIGLAGVTGSASYANGTYTVQGAGG
ncbi:MAG: IPT/TIG domain-containing protein, partial [Candidatus Acidiferrum sp.]